MSTNFSNYEPQPKYKIPTTMVVYRRHVEGCKHAGSGPGKGRDADRCKCPMWIDGVKDGQRHHYSLRTTDWYAAYRQLTKIERGETTPLKPVKDAVEIWRKSIRVQESTWRNYRQPLNALIGFCQKFGPQYIDQIDMGTLERFRDWRRTDDDGKQRIGAVRENGELSVLRLFFSWCLKRGWCMVNAAKLVDMHRLQPAEREPFTKEEIGMMLTACDAIGHGAYERKRARALILLLRHTALRISDASTLRKDRISNGKILLWTRKNGGQVYLPVPAELEQALLSLPTPKGGDRGHFFWSGKGKPRAAIGVAERLLASVFRKAGFARCQPHRFRHTLASEYLAAGYSERLVADILGITPAVVFKHYGKWMKERQDLINRAQADVQAMRESSIHATPALRRNDSKITIH